MNEVDIRQVERGLQRARDLEGRRCRVAVALQTKDALTDDLRPALLGAATLQEIEDIWAPYKQKKQTRAQLARAAGLLPLANLIEQLGGAKSHEEPCKVAANFCTSPELGYTGIKEALAGARDILAEKYARKTDVKERAREYLASAAHLTSKRKAGADTEENFKLYWDFDCPVKRVKPYQFLAIQRGEANKVLSVSFTLSDQVAESFVCQLVNTNKAGCRTSHQSWEAEWSSAMSDAFKAHSPITGTGMAPSFERAGRR